MTELTQALESSFGPIADWPLAIHAAREQLATLQQLAGDDYSTYIQHAQQAIDEHRDRAGISTTLSRRDRLGLLLYGTQTSHIDQPETLKVAWAINFGLEILLDDEQYEQIIDAAFEALQPATASAC